jgi:hypothetical protein
MNVHYVVAGGKIRRINSGEARAIGLTVGNNTAAPPRTREGQTYPGGRHRRRALARLAARKAGYQRDLDYRKQVSPATVLGLHEPGSMRG